MEKDAHISIHDVAPNTLDLVERMLDALQAAGVGRVMLLVIPGLPWTEPELNRLRRWFAAGHAPAGHGWTHHVEHRRGWYHKLHGMALSRHVAEHLALDADGIAELIRRNHAWFGEHDLPSPRHYVPPAWAMGRISRERLDALPFDTYETLGGVYDSTRHHFNRMPVQGFEADTRFRALALRIFNAWNRTRKGRMRLALHPRDLDLYLSPQLLTRCAAYRTGPDPLSGDGT